MTTLRRYGLLLATTYRNGYDRVSARLVADETNGKYPMNCRSDGESEHDAFTPQRHRGMQYADLVLEGFVSDDARLLLSGAEYRETFSVDLRTAERMCRTLKKIAAREAKDNAYEPGDRLLALARALHLEFIVTQVGDPRGSCYSDGDWRFMTLPEGRNLFRQMIEQVQESTRLRLGIGAKA